MLRSLSPWAINMALRCGEQFRRRIILNQIIPPSAAAGRGRGFHAAVDMDFKQKTVTKTDLPVDVLTDAARDEFVYAFRRGIHLTKDDAWQKRTILNDHLNQTILLTKRFHSDIAPEVQPVASELRLTADIGLDLPLKGFIDFVQAGHQIDDFKTAGRAWTQARADSELQPPIYSYLYGREFGAYPRRLGYRVLVHTPSGKIKKQNISARVTRGSIQGALNKAHAVYRMYKAGLFPPADPGAWQCSEKWCGYYLTCAYIGNGVKRWI